MEGISQRGNTTQAKVAEIAGTTTPYASHRVNGGDKVVNKAFISKMVGVDGGE